MGGGTHGEWGGGVCILREHVVVVLMEETPRESSHGGIFTRPGLLTRGRVKETNTRGIHALVFVTPCARIVRADDFTISRCLTLYMIGNLAIYITTAP